MSRLRTQGSQHAVCRNAVLHKTVSSPVLNDVGSFYQSRINKSLRQSTNRGYNPRMSSRFWRQLPNSQDVFIGYIIYENVRSKWQPFNRTKAKMGLWPTAHSFLGRFTKPGAILKVWTIINPSSARKPRTVQMFACFPRNDTSDSPFLIFLKVNSVFSSNFFVVWCNLS